MKIYVDIDKTICYLEKNNHEYSEALPLVKNIEKVNKLYDEGHEIIMWTARGTMTGINWFQITYNQLIKWNVKFHELRMNKPAFDILIDDKALNSIYNWNKKDVNNVLRLYDNNIKEIQLTKNRKIGGNNPCLIIAEIGQNHQGDINIAKKIS